MSRAAFAAGFVLLGSALGACGGSRDGITSLRTEVTMTPQALALAPGATDVVSVRITGGSPTPTLAGCSTANSAVATTISNGSGCVVTAVAPGATTVTARVSGGSSAVGVATVTVTAPPITVTLEPAAVNLVPGAATDVVVRISGNASVQACLSANPSVALASFIGGTLCRVTAVGPGTTSLTVTVTGGQSASAPVLVLEPTIARLVLTPTLDSLRPGGQRALVVVLQDGQGRPVTGRGGLTFRSSESAVATVDGAGVITAVAPGTTTITAAIPANTGSPVNVTATTTVVVVSPVRSLPVSPTTVRLRPGQSTALTASVVADPGTPTGIVWSSSNSTIASVVNGTATGATITAVSPGSAIITAAAAADPRVRTSVTVTVATGVDRVVLTPRLDSLRLATSRQLTATVTADPGVSTAATFTSRSPSVATVSASGVLQAVALGRATIVAAAQADPSVADSFTVVVSAARVQSVSVQPAAVSIQLNRGATLAASVAAEPGVSTAVEWVSLNPSVATVNQQGTVLGVSVGQAEIRARSVVENTVFGAAIVTVSSGIRSIAVSPRTADLVPSQSQQFIANVAVEPGTSSAVVWSSGSPSVATVSSAGVVQAIAPGRAFIFVRAAADPNAVDSASVIVADPCTLKSRLVIGSSFSGALNSTSCTLPGPFYRAISSYEFPNTQAVLRLSMSAAAGVVFVPMIARDGSWTFFDVLNANTCVIAPPGLWDLSVGSTQFTTYSITSGLATAPADCPSVVALSGARAQFTLNASSRRYNWTEPCAAQVCVSPVFELLGTQLELLPPLNVGQTISIAVTASGFRPTIDLLRDGDNNFRRSVSSTGSTAVLNYTADVGGFYRVRVLGPAPGGASTSFVVSITGPSALVTSPSIMLPRYDRGGFRRIPEQR